MGNQNLKIGLPPGSLMYLGEKNTGHSIQMLSYSPDEVRESPDLDMNDFETLPQNHIYWVDYCGLMDIHKLEQWGQRLGLGHMELEDILSIDHRPKIELFDNSLFIICHMITTDPRSLVVHKEQIAMAVSEQGVVLFQERPGDIFEPLRERVFKGKGRIRRSGSDYLAYCLLDIVVDYYFSVVEHVANKIEMMETQILEGEGEVQSHLIHQIRAELLMLRRAAQPMREVVSTLQKPETPIVNEQLQPFLTDLYDHCMQVIEMVEYSKEQVTSLFELQNANLNAKLNEVMKFLTIISTVFIPLSFIAGVYGMNFDIPLARHNYGYPSVLVAMATIGIAMIAWLKWKKWW